MKHANNHLNKFLRANSSRFYFIYFIFKFIVLSSSLSRSKYTRRMETKPIDPVTAVEKLGDLKLDEKPKIHSKGSKKEKETFLLKTAKVRTSYLIDMIG